MEKGSARGKRIHKAVLNRSPWRFLGFSSMEQFFYRLVVFFDWGEEVQRTIKTWLYRISAPDGLVVILLCSLRASLLLQSTRDTSKNPTRVGMCYTVSVNYRHKITGTGQQSFFNTDKPPVAMSYGNSQVFTSPARQVQDSKPLSVPPPQVGRVGVFFKQLRDNQLFSVPFLLLSLELYRTWSWFIRKQTETSGHLWNAPKSLSWNICASIGKIHHKII